MLSGKKLSLKKTIYNCPEGDESASEAKLDAIYEMLLQKSVTEKSLGDWIPEHLAMELSGLKKSSLFALRKAGKLTSSTISGKGVFYRRSDFERLLGENEIG